MSVWVRLPLELHRCYYGTAFVKLAEWSKAMVCKPSITGSNPVLHSIFKHEKLTVLYKRIKDNVVVGEDKEFTGNNIWYCNI